jgi:hypothetical protein
LIEYRDDIVESTFKHEFKINPLIEYDQNIHFLNHSFYLKLIKDITAANPFLIRKLLSIDIEYDHNYI